MRRIKLVGLGTRGGLASNFDPAPRPQRTWNFCGEKRLAAGARLREASHPDRTVSLVPIPGAGERARGPTLAVFASDKGPGDAERASIMSQAGTYFARRGARIVCLAEGKTIAIPLITSARAAGGEITVISDEGFSMPRALSGVPVEKLADPAMRVARMAELADVFVGLPGSLASISNLYMVWQRAGAGAAGKPIVLYNRNNAFEVLRGFTSDVLSHSVKHSERIVQFADSIEDLWSRIHRLAG